MATKIFVRERRKVEKGEKKPRFRIVGVSGSDVKIYASHIRKNELDQIGRETGAEIVFLQAGKEQNAEGDEERNGSSASPK